MVSTHPGRARPERAEGAARADFVADFVAWVWLGGVLVVVGLTWRDYGITWDEAWHLEYGDHIYAWFASLGADRSALSYRLDYLYGGAFDLLGSVARRISPLAPYDTMHLLGGGWSAYSGSPERGGSDVDSGGRSPAFAASYC